MGFFPASELDVHGAMRVQRLVADEDFHSLVRTEGAQRTRLGSGVASQFWLSCRPYESANL